MRKTLIVHLDRLRPYCSQVLSYETETYNSDLEKEKVENDAEEPPEESLVMLGNSELNEIELDYSGRRQRDLHGTLNTKLIILFKPSYLFYIFIVLS